MSRRKITEPILDAAAQWRTRCLLDGGSILSKQRLWSKENFALLQHHYVDNPKSGTDTFFQKLKTQLESAPTDVMQLSAEILWVMYLIVSKNSMSGDTKRFQILDVWNWSGAAIEPDQWVLHAPLDDGAANPGTAYHTHRWREFSFFITSMIAWFDLSMTEKTELLEDPWTFGQWLGGRSGAKGRQVRHALLFLLFPDHYEDILSGSNKRAIVAGYSNHWKESLTLDYSDLLAVDRKLLAVRERAESESTDVELTFYNKDQLPIWQKQETEPPEREELTRLPLAEAQVWFRERFGDVGVWMFSAGEGSRLWPSFRREGLAAIGFGDAIGDLSQYESKNAVRDALIQGGAGANPVNDTLAVWQFAHEVKRGDIVIVKKGRYDLLGWGTVTGSYEYRPERPEYPHVRQMKWTPTDPVNFRSGGGFPGKTLTDFSPYKDWVHLAFTLP